MMPGKYETTRQPIAVVGAGDLISHLHRIADELNVWRYEFNVFRFEKNGEATHVIRSTDLRDVVKLCQVLAYTVADDGWTRDETRKELFDLASTLDKVTQRWSESSYGT